MPSAIGRARIRLVVLLMILAIAAPAGLAAARYPEYWKWIALEETPMTWLQTVLLIVAAAGCGVITVIGSVREWRFTAIGSLPHATSASPALRGLPQATSRCC